MVSSDLSPGVYDVIDMKKLTDLVERIFCYWWYNCENKVKKTFSDLMKSNFSVSY